jgi:hypothetical protein
MNRQLLQRAGVTLAMMWALTWLAGPAAAQAPGTVWAWGYEGAGCDGCYQRF